MNTTVQSEPIAPVFGFQPLAAITLTPDTAYLQLSRRKKNGEQCLNVVWTDDKGTFDEYEDDEVGWEVVGLMLASTVIETFTPAPANKNLFTRLTMLIKFETDMDMIPGWGHKYPDWERLATERWSAQSHYRTAYKLLGVHQQRGGGPASASSELFELQQEKTQ